MIEIKNFHSYFLGKITPFSSKNALFCAIYEIHKKCDIFRGKNQFGIHEIPKFRKKIDDFHPKLENHEKFWASSRFRRKFRWSKNKNFFFYSQEIHVRKINSRISFRMIQGICPMIFSILPQKFFQSSSSK